MVDYQTIKRQVDEVISYSQGIADPQTEELLQRWMKAKEYYIEFFGGLTYEVGPIQIHLDEDTKENMLDEFLDTLANVYQNYDLIDFITANKENFYANKIEKSYHYNDITIPAGMKLIRAFKFFEDNPSALHDMQDLASRLIQEDKIEGKLCLSVHPLDYLSSSMNNHNWRSCHALDGEYRSGNLSYMVDTSTVICYIKANEDMSIPLFPEHLKWNSKKWRVLIFLSEDHTFMMAGKQYPFSSMYALDEVRLALAKVLHIEGKFSPFYNMSGWKNEYILEEENELNADLNDKYLVVRGDLVALNDIVYDVEGDSALHFNDLLRSCTYKKPFYAMQGEYRWMGEHFPHPKIPIGGRVACPQSGCHDLTISETMRCEDCELKYGHEENDVFTSCNCCGSRMYRDNATVVEDNDVVCDKCFKKYCFICDRCDEIHYLTNRIYDKEYDEYVCNYCYNERKEMRENYGE